MGQTHGRVRYSPPASVFLSINPSFSPVLLLRPYFQPLIEMSSNDPDHREEAGENAAVEDEDTGAQIAPIVRLEEVAVSTGEEEEDALLDLKAKLYRFDKEGSQWKERGTGNVKILKHKQTGKARLVMRQAKTLKICANHLILPSIKLQEHAGNEKSCVWHATDFSDGELKDETFCIRFGTVDNCKLFMDAVEKQAEAMGKNEEKESKEVNAAAGELQNLNVGRIKDEEKAKDEVPTVAVDEAAEKVKAETKTKSPVSVD